MAVKYDEATGYKLCKHGHVRSPENVNKRRGCKVCEKARSQTPEHKAREKAYKKTYAQTSKFKAYQKAYQKAYKQTPEYKAYKQTPEYKEYRNAQVSRRVRQLADGYIAFLLGIPAKQATPELIELKRLSTQLHRSLKCQKQNSL